MAAELKSIPGEPGSELAGIIDQAGETPVVFERNGRWFRLVPEEQIDPFANYDPERVRRAFERAAGMLSGIDTEALKAELRYQRGHGRKAPRQ
jgi:hypothetical protein